ncbi:MAG: homoserine dehydrogenase [Caldilineae bacterium]|nr:homoserine dehydrogenase [Caldilineae bacterium]
MSDLSSASLSRNVQTVDLILVGLGNVHRRFLHLLDSRRDTLAARYGLRLRVVAASDSRGALADPAGIDPAALLSHKEAGGNAGNAPGGQPGATVLDILGQARADVLLEASPVNLVDAEPALSFVLGALNRGMNVVLANKAPLALRYRDLQRAADANGARLAFSATVCGGLPVVNVGTRDLVAAEIRRVQGIFNSTSNYILTEMAAGQSYADALAEAQRRGIAETNPRLDVEGWDTANKLTIVANAVLGFDCTVRDVQPVAGIGAADGLNEGIVKLLGVAERRADGSYDLSVQPVSLAIDHKLAQVSGWQMGVMFESDLFEEVFIAIDERGPTGTAAAMLRDVVNLYRDR